VTGSAAASIRISAILRGASWSRARCSSSEIPHSVGFHDLAQRDVQQGKQSELQAGTVADRMKARIAMMEGMVASMKAQSTAIENLYEVLTDEQKKKGDQPLGMGMM
jgi:hypothetical protein